CLFFFSCQGKATGGVIKNIRIFCALSNRGSKKLRTFLILFSIVSVASLSQRICSVLRGNRNCQSNRTKQQATDYGAVNFHYKSFMFSGCVSDIRKELVARVHGIFKIMFSLRAFLLYRQISCQLKIFFLSTNLFFHV